MKKFKFALLGCGRIAERHAEQITKYASLSAVCDIKHDRADQFALKFNSLAYYELDQLLINHPEIDVISICTPNGLHAIHSIQCLKAGHHVLCEKPMALSVAEANEMIKESEKAKKLLFIVKQNRFNPPVLAVKKLIDEGKLGKIYSVHLNCFWNRNEKYYNESDWKGTLKHDGGILFTQFSHFIDIIYWLIGELRIISGLRNNYKHQDIIEFEDTGAALVEFENGAIGSINYNINSYQKNMEGSITIFAENGTVKIGGQYLNELEYQQFDGYKITNLPEGNPANEYGEYNGSMSNHHKVYEKIIDVLDNKGIIATNANEAMKTVEIIEKIYSISTNTEPNKPNSHINDRPK